MENYFLKSSHFFYTGRACLAFISEHFPLFLPLCVPFSLSSLAESWSPVGSVKHCHFLHWACPHLDGDCIFAMMWELRSVQPYAMGLDDGLHSKQVRCFPAHCLYCVEMSKPSRYIPPCPLYLSFCFLASLCPALLRTLCPPSATHLLSIWNSVWGHPCSVGLIPETWGLLVSPGWPASEHEDFTSPSPQSHGCTTTSGFLHDTGVWTRGTQVP